MRAACFVFMLLCASVAPAGAQSIDALSREVADANWEQQEEPRPMAPVQVGEKLRRASEGVYSLILPGWTQLRQGHKTRGALLIGAETAVWTTWVVSRIQGAKREDAYEDYAVQFAGIGSGDHDEAYWKALGAYRDSDAYNDDVQRDLRLGGEPEGPAYGGSDAWRWESEGRFQEYRKLRSDSLGAYDRAETVILFALLTRAIGLIDGVRTAVMQPEADGASLRLTPELDPSDPGARLAFRQSF